MSLSADPEDRTRMSAVRRTAAMAHLGAHVKSAMLDGADHASDRADAMRARVRKANKAVHDVLPKKTKGLFAGLHHFSVTQAAGDAFADRQDRHRSIAKARVAKFMETKFVTRYPGQTFGERKGQLFKNFTTAISTFKDAGILKKDIKKIDRETKFTQRETMMALREKKAAAAVHVYDEAVKAGKIVPVADPRLSKADQVHIALGDSRELRKAARVLRDQVRKEMKDTRVEFSKKNSQVQTAIRDLSAGDRSVSRLMGKLFKVGAQGAAALNASRKNSDDKTSYNVRRLGGRIKLESRTAVGKVAAVAVGATHAVGAGTVEAASKAVHVASNATHAMTTPLRRTKAGMA